MNNRQHSRDLGRIPSRHKNNSVTVGVIERRGREAKNPASYSGNPGFKSRPGQQLSWLRLSRISSAPSGKCRNSSLNYDATASSHIIHRELKWAILSCKESYRPVCVNWLPESQYNTNPERSHCVFRERRRINTTLSETLFSLEEIFKRRRIDCIF
jgi:hypothetical protein